MCGEPWAGPCSLLQRCPAAPPRETGGTGAQDPGDRARQMEAGRRDRQRVPDRDPDAHTHRSRRAQGRWEAETEREEGVRI